MEAFSYYSTSSPWGDWHYGLTEVKRFNYPDFLQTASFSDVLSLSGWDLKSSSLPYWSSGPLFSYSPSLVFSFICLFTHVFFPPPIGFTLVEVLFTTTSILLYCSDCFVFYEPLFWASVLHTTARFIVLKMIWSWHMSFPTQKLSRTPQCIWNTSKTT